MRKAALVFASAIAITLLGASRATADNLDFITSGQNHSGNYFTYDDIVPWNQLGYRFGVVPNGTTVWSNDCDPITITFGFGGSGTQYLQGQTWYGNFAAGEYLLTNIRPNTTDAGEGPISLTFGEGVVSAGFQMQTNATGLFEAEIGVYDGSALLGTFFGAGDSTDMGRNSAVFFGVTDLTGANITSIKIAAYNCAYGDATCSSGFAINHLEFHDDTTPETPEPADLALVGTGLATLAYLRRRYSARK